MPPPTEQRLHRQLSEPIPSTMASSLPAENIRISAPHELFRTQSEQVPTRFHHEHPSSSTDSDTAALADELFDLELDTSPTSKSKKLRIPSFIAPPEVKMGPFQVSLHAQLLAEAALDSSDFQTAAHHYARVVPRTPHTMFNIGMLQTMMFNNIQACETLVNAVTADESFCVGWFQLAYVYFRMRQYPDAMDAWLNAAKWTRKRGVVDYNQLGLAYKVKIKDIIWNQAACEAVTSKGEGGIRPHCVPVGAVFRVPDHLADIIYKKPGEGADWMFAGRGKVVGTTLGAFGEGGDEGEEEHGEGSELGEEYESSAVYGGYEGHENGDGDEEEEAEGGGDEEVIDEGEEEEGGEEEGGDGFEVGEGEGIEVGEEGEEEGEEEGIEEGIEG